MFASNLLISYGFWDSLCGPMQFDVSRTMFHDNVIRVRRVGSAAARNNDATPFGVVPTPNGVKTASIGVEATPIGV